MRRDDDCALVASLIGAEYMPKDWNDAHYQQFRTLMDEHQLEPDVRFRLWAFSFMIV
jgi:hypothetical protein